jgi:hypothetical protein
VYKDGHLNNEQETPHKRGREHQEDGQIIEGNTLAVVLLLYEVKVSNIGVACALGRLALAALHALEALILAYFLGPVALNHKSV